ncbi:hypothetical protein LIA77_04060 [Sarocladium implicatum]|nr:hypothetical protein LIA77_04060 [Sarocladium implicatum]
MILRVPHHRVARRCPASNDACNVLPGKACFVLGSTPPDQASDFQANRPVNVAFETPDLQFLPWSATYPCAPWAPCWLDGYALVSLSLTRHAFCSQGKNNDRMVKTRLVWVLTRSNPCSRQAAPFRL